MTEKYKYLFTYWSSCSLWACCEWIDGRWVGRGMNETLEQCYEAEGLEVYDTLFPPKDKPIKPSKYKEQEPSPPSLIPLWWKSFKEKTCVKIVVADDVEEK